MLRAGIAQTDCVLGDIQKNLRRHMDFIREASSRKINILAFPELSLSGYLLKDSAREKALTIGELVSLFSSADLPDIVFSLGFPERGKNRKIYNSQALLFSKSGNVSILGVQRKINLPSYGMFDEAHFFNSGENMETYATEEGIGVFTAICEDAWHPACILSSALKNNLPDILIFPAASPSRSFRKENPGNIEGWKNNIIFHVNVYGSFIMNPQRTGVEDNFIFSGGSCMAGPNGDFVQAPLMEEALISMDLDLHFVCLKRQKSSVLSHSDRIILNSAQKRC